jgi:hypothetical protein
MSPGGTEETSKKRQYSRFMGQDFNPGPPKYEAEVLTTQPQHLVMEIWKFFFSVDVF